MRRVLVPFCLHMRFTDQPYGLLGQDIEFQSGERPVRSEGG